MRERCAASGLTRSTPWRIVCLVGVMALALIATSLGSAQARTTHPYLFTVTLPEADFPEGLGVNQATHELFVVAVRAEAVYRYDMNGQQNPTKPRLTGLPAEFHPRFVAVDNSATATGGFVYVSGVKNFEPGSIGGIQQFSPSGAATAVKITESAVPTDGTPQAGGLPNVVNDGSFWPGPITVDSSGNVYAKDVANEVIDKFSPAGVFLAQFPAGSFGSAGGLAVNATGEIYLANGPGGLIKRNAKGECVNSCVPIDSAQAESVAINAAGDIVLAATVPGGAVIREFDPSGTLISESSSPHLILPRAVALDEASGRIWVSNEAASAGPPAVSIGVTAFGPTIILPDATTQAPSAVTSTGATLNGAVSAAEGSPATCQFEYTTDAAFNARGFEGAETAACEPSGPFSGGGITHVQHTVGLVGGTTYRYRLVASSSLGSTQGADELISTPGPSILSEAASDISETSATLEAAINPRGEQTTYQFEYVDQASFDVSGFAGAARVPASSTGIGAGSVGIAVSQGISNLAPGATYHFRVIATNAEGTTISNGGVFRTYTTAEISLPDGRRYEQASPTDKNGASLQLETNSVQAAEDGNGITFFLNAGLPGGEGAQSFPSFLATRAPDGSGWSTQGLLPPATTGPVGRIAGWTEDLKTSFATNKSSAGEPPALYVRNSSDHSLAQIVRGGDGGGKGFSVADSEGPWVMFESQTGQLAAGAAAGRANTYLWNQNTGELVLAGVLNNKKSPSLGSFAGSYDWWVSGSPTGGGSESTTAAGVTSRYYTRAQHVLSAGASRLFFTAAGTGQIYMRINPTAQQSTLDSHGKCKEPSKACTIEISAPEEGVVDPQGEKPAAFIGATPDGMTAFFLSAEDLTKDARTGSGDGKDLYRYEAGTETLTDLTSDEEDENGAAVQGVIGTSEDGEYIYLAANGVLAPGAKPGDCRIAIAAGRCNLYLLHGSTFTFIAQVEPGRHSSGGSDVTNWAPTSETYEGGGTFYEEKAGRVTPDGLTLLFRSSRSVTGYQNNGFTELYRYRVGQAGPTCITCAPTNSPATGNASVQTLQSAFTGPRLLFSIITRNLSADGNRVFFETPERLVPNDTNGVGDVYEWEANGSGTCSSSDQAGGCIYLVSSGSSPSPSYFGDASLDGNDVFFFTSQSLVKQDQDELVDVYDARVGGGIAAQEQEAPIPCTGEQCLGSGTQPTGLPQPQSTVGLPGNPPRPKCKPHFKRVTKKGKQRCVRIKSHPKKSKGKPKKKKHQTNGKRHDKGRHHKGSAR